MVGVMITQPLGTQTRGEASDGRSVLLSGMSRLAVLPVAAAGTLLATRLTIGSVGAAAFGYVSVIATLVVLLPFADLGLGAAITNAAAETNDLADDAHLDRVLLTSLRALSISGALIILLALFVGVSFGWGVVLGISNTNFKWVNVSSVVVLTLFACTLPLTVGQRLLLGAKRNHLVVAANTVSAPVSLGGIALLARVHASPAFFAIPPVLGLAASSVLALVIARRLTGVRVLRLVIRLPNTASWPGTAVRATALPMFVILVGLPIALQSDRLVIAHRSTRAALSAYSLVAPLYSSLLAVLSTAGLALWPIFAQRRQRLRVPSAVLHTKRLWHRMLIGFGGAALVGGLLLVLVGPWLLQLVSNHEIGVPTALLMGFAGLLLVQALHLPSGMLMTDSVGLRFQAIAVSLMLVLNLSVTWVLTPRYGALGPLLGSIFGIGIAQLLPGLLRVSRLLRDEAAEDAPMVPTCPQLESG